MTVELFVAAVPGLESVVAEELLELGAPAGKVLPGGIELQADPSWVGRINRGSFCATRVLVRLGRFSTRHLSELQRRVARLDWLGLIDQRPIRLKVTSRTSRLYHTEAIAERVHTALNDLAGRSLERSRGENVPADLAELQTIQVRIESDEVTLSLDSSGDHLHRRGYRHQTAKAPLRETLAACFLRWASWPEPGVLLDPMCGSGTIPIEAALMASGVAPGTRRRFSFESWPKETWDSVPPTERPATTVRIVARDRDRGAIEATLANAERAGVADRIEAEAGALSGVTRVSERGLLLTNPPFGRRIGRHDPLRNLYATLGSMIRGELNGWRALVLGTDPTLIRATGCRFQARTNALDHGGVPIRIFELES